MITVSPHILRANSIRGRFGTDLDERIAVFLGAHYAAETGGRLVVVGSDHRTSSPALREALIEGLCAGGADVMDVGAVPRGLAMFASWRAGAPSAYVTASHLTREWNGLKFAHAGGMPLDREENARIYVRLAGPAPVEGTLRLPLT